jgi:hypothetical protein
MATPDLSGVSPGPVRSKATRGLFFPPLKRKVYEDDGSPPGALRDFLKLPETLQYDIFKLAWKSWAPPSYKWELGAAINMRVAALGTPGTRSLMRRSSQKVSVFRRYAHVTPILPASSSFVLEISRNQDRFPLPYR